MSVLSEKAIDELKWLYNHNLTRYYNGCNYIDEHSDTADKYLPNLMEILEDMNALLDEIMKEQEITDDEILNGFSLGGSL